MEKIKLGRTDLMVTRTAFGALPIQRLSFDEAKVILQKAYQSGINFFDTARMYSNSEEKIGYALSDVRKDIIIATKSHAKDKKTMMEHLETSLKNMKTDYVDILQLHNPSVLPDPDDPDSLFAGLLEARKRGLVRYISITNHSLDNALKAAESGLYDTVQFPLSYLSSDADLKLIEECQKRDIGLIAMKALSGGLITNATMAFAFLRQYPSVVPIWGIQRESELDEFIELEKNSVSLNDDIWKEIEKDRVELAGDFCRACGYCLPCPANIEIPMAARMSLFLNRSVYQNFVTEEYKAKMMRIKNCTHCGNCLSHCPYGLDTPNLLKKELKYYLEFYEKHKND